MAPKRIFRLSGFEFIQLNQLLKIEGLVETGGEANQRITGGEVLVNDEPELRKRRKLRTGDRVYFSNTEITII